MLITILWGSHGNIESNKVFHVWLQATIQPKVINYNTLKSEWEQNQELHVGWKHQLKNQQSEYVLIYEMHL